MKISAKAGILASALSMAGTVRANKTVPSAAHLVAADDSILILCSDNAIGAIRVDAAATVDESGEIAVPADRMAALVSGFPAISTVAIRTTVNGPEIVSGCSRSRLPILTDLPVTLALDKEIAALELSCNQIITLLEPIVVADDERAPFNLSGIFWHNVGDEFVAVATNGVRLIRCSIAAGDFSNDRSAILPAKVAIDFEELKPETLFALVAALKA